MFLKLFLSLFFQLVDLVRSLTKSERLGLGFSPFDVLFVHMEQFLFKVLLLFLPSFDLLDPHMIAICSFY